MGSGTYNHDEYREIQNRREVLKKPAFEHSRDVQRGHDDRGQKVEAKVHPTLDIFGKIRESRDSDGVSSIAIAYILDVTGSMQRVPEIIQKCLPKAMRLLIDQGYTRENPQVLFGAVGDAHGDAFPLQIGQFEADLRMEAHLTNVILEGGGGSWGEYSHESYELALFFLGTRTQIDCWEKRHKKGYAFIFGDEHPYPKISKKDQEEIFGIPNAHDLPVEAAIKATTEKYHLFYIIPGGTMHAREEGLAQRWGKLLGDEWVNIGDNRVPVSPFVIKLDAPELASEATCLIIGLTEGTVPSLEDGLSHLQANPSEKAAIRQALLPYATYLAKQRA